MYETKDLAIDRTELKFREAESGAVRVAGYASIFGGTPDSYGDVIAAGAYKTAIDAVASGRHIPMVFEHEHGQIIGKWLTLKEDDRGLAVDGELTPGHTKASDVAALLRHGAITGLSIGYRPRKSARGQDGTRILQDIDLREISIVGHPAHQETRVSSVKAEEIATPREFEAWLREEGGYSRREAAIISERGFKALSGTRDGSRAGGDDDNRRDDGRTVADWLRQLRELRAR